MDKTFSASFDPVAADKNRKDLIANNQTVVVGGYNLANAAKDQIDAEALAQGGYKADTGKARFDLVPPDAMYEVAKLYALGAKKYADRNWEKGMNWGQLTAALERHLNAWKAGEQYDPVDGQPHLASVVWCGLGLLAYELRGIGNDDRNKVGIKR